MWITIARALREQDFIKCGLDTGKACSYDFITFSLCEESKVEDRSENIALIERKDKLAGQLPKGSSSTCSQKTRKHPSPP